MAQHVLFLLKPQESSCFMWAGGLITVPCPCLVPTHQIQCRHRGILRLGAEHCLAPFATLSHLPEPLSLLALTVCVQAFLPSVFQDPSSMPTWSSAFSVLVSPAYVRFIEKTSRAERPGFSEKALDASMMGEEVKFLSPSSLSSPVFPTPMHTLQYALFDQG